MSNFQEPVEKITNEKHLTLNRTKCLIMAIDKTKNITSHHKDSKIYLWVLISNKAGPGLVISELCRENLTKSKYDQNGKCQTCQNIEGIFDILQLQSTFKNRFESD